MAPDRASFACLVLVAACAGRRDGARVAAFASEPRDEPPAPPEEAEAREPDVPRCGDLAVVGAGACPDAAAALRDTLRTAAECPEEARVLRCDGNATEIALIYASAVQLRTVVARDPTLPVLLGTPEVASTTAWLPHADESPEPPPSRLFPSRPIELELAEWLATHATLEVLAVHDLEEPRRTPGVPPERRYRLLRVRDGGSETVCVLGDDWTADRDPDRVAMAPTAACARPLGVVEDSMEASPHDRDRGVVVRFALRDAGEDESTLHALLDDGSIVRGSNPWEPRWPVRLPWPPHWTNGQPLFHGGACYPGFPPNHRLGHRTVLDPVEPPEILALFMAHPNTVFRPVSLVPGMFVLGEGVVTAIGGLEWQATAVAVRSVDGWALGPIGGEVVWSGAQPAGGFSIVTADGRWGPELAGVEMHAYTWSAFELRGALLVPRARAVIARQVTFREEGSSADHFYVARGQRYSHDVEEVGPTCVRFDTRGGWDEMRDDRGNLFIEADRVVDPALDMTGTWSFAAGPLVRADCEEPELPVAGGE